MSCPVVTGGAGASRDTTPTPQVTIGSDEAEESILQDTEPISTEGGLGDTPPEVTQGIQRKCTLSSWFLKDAFLTR